jgi:plasmid stabilization system protein ParE
VIYELHPEAEAELTSATLYYSKEASRSIALAFLAEFERVAELVEANQQLGTKSKGSLRVYPFRRFPYSIVYRELAGGPYFYAVAHRRQEPGYWLGRI